MFKPRLSVFEISQFDLEPTTGLKCADHTNVAQWSILSGIYGSVFKLSQYVGQPISLKVEGAITEEVLSHVY